MCKKIILDATCGARTMWFDKQNPRTVFFDKRCEHYERMEMAAMRLKADGEKAEIHLPYGDKIMEYAPEANGRRGKKMGLEE